MLYSKKYFCCCFYIISMLLFLGLNMAKLEKRPNSPGCEPGIHRFESGISPQTKSKWFDIMYRTFLNKVIVWMYLDLSIRGKRNKYLESTNLFELQIICLGCSNMENMLWLGKPFYFQIHQMEQNHH